MTLTLTGCVEHRYEIDVRYDGSVATRTVTIERALHGGDDQDSRQNPHMPAPLDPEEVRLSELYGQGVPASTINGKSDAATQHFGESARQYVGRFDRVVPDDLGGAGEIVRCESPIGSAILYYEVIRPTPNVAEHLTQAQRILDALVDATIDVFQAEYGADRAWPSLRATVTGAVRSDLHHLLACGWAIYLADRLEPTAEKGASSTDSSTDVSRGTWWRMELVQRHYLSPAQAIQLLVGEESSVDSLPEVIALGIESRCRHLGANAAADLAARIRADLTSEEAATHPEGEADPTTDPATEPDAGDLSHQPDSPPDSPSYVPSNGPSVAKALQERLAKAIESRMHEALPSLAMPGWPPISHGADASESDDESPFFAAAVAMAFPGIAISMRYDSVSLHATLPGSVVATNGKPSATGGAGRDGTTHWSGSVLPTPGMPGDMGLRAWLVTAVPDESEQRRLWGRIRCDGKSLAEVAALFAALSASEQGAFRSALAASRDERAWSRFLQTRAEVDTASSGALDRAIDALSAVLEAP
ncbi:MAG: hypothetical protein JNL80_06965 [Phycisphaerae bacterium]|nr:hypothetical protein [Phycisphaerae bacterium]